MSKVTKCQIETVDKKMVAKNVNVANSMLSRMKGLMFDKKMEGMDGLLIRPCNSIHTFFMKYKIDVVFMNKKNVVLKIMRNLPPWRVTRIYFGATQVLEMEGGSLIDEVQVGDQLEVTCIN